jgi:hypothetical protein
LLARTGAADRSERAGDLRRFFRTGKRPEHYFSSAVKKRKPAQSPAETTDGGGDFPESSFIQPENPFAETAGERQYRTARPGFRA